MQEQVDAILEQWRQELVTDVAAICRIPSIKEAHPYLPFGAAVDAALVWALQRGADFGFSAVNLDHYIGYLEYGASEEYVAVLGHLDVVPPGEGWTMPPFQPVVRAGRLYGRGVLDDKGPVVACLYAMRALKACGIVPLRKIRLILGLDEESAGADVRYYLTHEPPPYWGFTPDGRFPVVRGEKGLLTVWLQAPLRNGQRIVALHGGVRSNMVPDECRVVLRVAADERALIFAAIQETAATQDVALVWEDDDANLCFKTIGKTAHASHPEQGRNAITAMLRILATVLSSDMGDDVQFIRWCAAYVGEETDGQSLGIACSSAEWGALTVNVGLVERQAAGLRLKLNIRYPKVISGKEILYRIQQQALLAGIRLEEPKEQPPLYFPQDAPLVSTLLKAYHRYEGGGQPLCIGGSTFAKAMPNIVAFGPTFAGDAAVAHQADEYMEIDRLLQAAKIYANALYCLACCS